jgi:hypothetical protein
MGTCCGACCQGYATLCRMFTYVFIVSAVVLSCLALSSCEFLTVSYELKRWIGSRKWSCINGGGYDTTREEISVCGFYLFILSSRTFRFFLTTCRVKAVALESSASNATVPTSAAFTANLDTMTSVGCICGLVSLGVSKFPRFFIVHVGFANRILLTWPSRVCCSSFGSVLAPIFGFILLILMSADCCCKVCCSKSLQTFLVIWAQICQAMTFVICEYLPCIVARWNALFTS